MNKNNIANKAAEQMQQKEHFIKVGERIKELRISHQWSIKGYEEMLGLPSGAIHNIEHGNGGSGINFLTIINHLASLGYSYKWLLEFDNDKNFKREGEEIYIDIDKNQLIEVEDEFKSTLNKFKKIISKYK